MNRCILLLLVWTGTIITLSQPTQAQHVLRLSDEDCVQLSLDMIRKGIQQQDTARVMKVTGEEVLVDSTAIRSHDWVAQNLDKVFANSSKRAKVPPGRAIARAATKDRRSNLWDFDILQPQIRVVGDSAIVECQLVLWEADTGDASETGARAAERLVFWSPFEGQTEMVASNDPLRWRLVECDRLFEFLGAYGVLSASPGKSGEVDE